MNLRTNLGLRSSVKIDFAPPITLPTLARNDCYFSDRSSLYTSPSSSPEIPFCYCKIHSLKKLKERVARTINTILLQLIPLILAVCLYSCPTSYSLFVPDLFKQPSSMGILISCIFGSDDAVAKSTDAAAVKQGHEGHFGSDEIDKLRKEAHRLGDLRHKLLNESQQAYKSGNKSLAHTKSVEGKALAPKIDDCNKKAVVLILGNQNLKSGVLDLHGLYLNEAVTASSNFLSSSTKTFSVILIITGAGHHSVKHDKPVIRPKIEEMLKKKGLKFEETHNRGALKIYLGGSGRVFKEINHHNRV